ncbi:MAG: divalent-cation tolerance protein CutA [Bdellovibrio sp.]
MKLIYIPCSDKKSAEQIARTLLEEKRIGCAQILPEISSFYWWEGRLEKSSECLLLLKTSLPPDQHRELVARVSELHPYDVPCIMTLPIEGINEPYQKWLEDSLK